MYVLTNFRENGSSKDTFGNKYSGETAWRIWPSQDKFKEMNKGKDLACVNGYYNIDYER